MTDVKTSFLQLTDPTFGLRPEGLGDVPEKRPTRIAFQSMMLGAELYFKDCVKCHDPLGHGDGPSAGNLDVRGRPIKAYDFTGGANRSGPRDMDLYRSFATTLAGTPVPSCAQTITDMERWALMNHIRAFRLRRDLFHRLLLY